MGTDHLIELSSGVRLSYREIGSTTGRAVLYLHGTPGSRMEVEETLSDEAATLGLRVLAPDRPGCGRSPFVRYDVRDYPEHIMGLLAVLEVDEIGIIGVSGGGRYACACAARLGSRVSLAATMTEAFHQGTRGAVHDIGLEARPWNIDLAAIETPVDIWHGCKDTLVPVAQGEALARAIPSASSRLLPEEGHVSLRVNRIAEFLEPLA